MANDTAFQQMFAPPSDDKKPPTTLYQLIPGGSYGISAEGKVMAGLELRKHPKSNSFDILEWLVAERGSDAVLKLPNEGLIPGEVYEAEMVNVQRRPEDGYVSSFDIELRPSHYPDPELNASG